MYKQTYVIWFSPSPDHLCSYHRFDVLHCLVEYGHGVDNHVVLSFLVGSEGEREGGREGEREGNREVEREEGGRGRKEGRGGR